jgi:putative flippase GtrA
MQLFNIQTKEFFGYLLVVTVGLAVDYGVLFALITFTPIWYLYAAGISFLLALVSNYVLASRLVFHVTSHKNAAKSFIVFATIGFSTLLINQIVLYLLIEYALVPLFIAKTLTLPITFTWNFFANKKFVFSPQNTQI